MKRQFLHPEAVFFSYANMADVVRFGFAHFVAVAMNYVI